MVSPEQAQWVLEKIVVPGLVGLGGALLGARRARRTIHVSRLTEAEARAYRPLEPWNCPRVPSA